MLSFVTEETRGLVEFLCSCHVTAVLSCSSIPTEHVEKRISCLRLFMLDTWLHCFSPVKTGWQTHAAAGQQVGTHRGVPMFTKALNCSKMLLISLIAGSITGRAPSPRGLRHTGHAPALQKNDHWNRSFLVSPPKKQSREAARKKISCRGRNNIMFACLVVGVLFCFCVPFLCVLFFGWLVGCFSFVHFLFACFMFSCCLWVFFCFCLFVFNIVLKSFSTPLW